MKSLVEYGENTEEAMVDTIEKVPKKEHQKEMDEEEVE